MAEDTMLAEAISAAKAGEMPRARDLLARLLRADSSNPDYWLWMSSIVESERESVYCLRSVTKMRPGHPWARLGLAALGQISLAAERAAPSQQHRSIPFPHQAAGSINSMADWWNIRRNRDNMMIAILGAILSVLVVLVIAGSLQSSISTLSQALIPMAATPTRKASPSALSTSVTALHPSLPAKTGTPVGLVPLATYVGNSSTPTALYGVTPSSAAFDLGMKSFESGQYSDALAQFQTAERMSSQDAQITYYLAETLRKLRRMPEALDAYNRTIQLNSQYALGHYGLAMWHKQDNPGSGYVDELNKALALDPKMIDAYIERAYYSAYRQNDWLSARADLEQAVALNPNHALALIRLGRAQVETGQNSAALVNLVHAQIIDPTIIEGYLGLGEAFYALGLYTVGEAPLNTYTTYDPGDIEGWILSCKMYTGAADYDPAITAGTKALEIDTNSTDARIARGEAYRLDGQYYPAVGDLKVAEERAPNWYDALLAYGRALVLANDPSAAVGILDDAINRGKLGQLNESITPAQMADLIGWDAKAYDQKGDSTHGTALWTQLYSLDGAPESWKVEAYRHILKLADTATPASTANPTVSATP